MQQLASVTSENYLDVLGDYDGFLLFPQTSPMSFVGCKGCKKYSEYTNKISTISSVGRISFPQLAESSCLIEYDILCNSIQSARCLSQTGLVPPISE